MSKSRVVLCILLQQNKPTTFVLSDFSLYYAAAAFPTVLFNLDLNIWDIYSATRKK